MNLLRVSRQSGFSIVEVLVALVLLTVGLLGIAALYLDSLQAGRTAIYRTQAVNLASDFADRVRSNRTAIVAYDVAFGVTMLQVDACFTTVGCQPAELASSDIKRWKDAIALQLPNGDAQVVVTAPIGAGEPANYLVTIQWSEVGEAQPVQFQIGFST